MPLTVLGVDLPAGHAQQAASVPAATATAELGAGGGAGEHGATWDVACDGRSQALAQQLREREGSMRHTHRETGDAGAMPIREVANSRVVRAPRLLPPASVSGRSAFTSFTPWSIALQSPGGPWRSSTKLTACCPRGMMIRASQGSIVSYGARASTSLPGLSLCSRAT